MAQHNQVNSKYHHVTNLINAISYRKMKEVLLASNEPAGEQSQSGAGRFSQMHSLCIFQFYKNKVLHLYFEWTGINTLV